MSGRVERLIIGLLEMERRGWSLVAVRDRWYFCVSEQVPDRAETDTPYVTAGGVVRCGHFASPIAAIMSLVASLEPPHAP